VDVCGKFAALDDDEEVEVALEMVEDEIAAIVAVVRKPVVAIESLLKSFGRSWERSSWMPCQYSNDNFRCGRCDYPLHLSEFVKRASG
jgi:hypothetical protein